MLFSDYYIYIVWLGMLLLIGKNMSIPQHGKIPFISRNLLPSIDSLWIMAAVVLAGCFTSMVPTPPTDFWWHLRAGQIIATQGIPTTNIFAWSLPADRPYLYATWLAEWLFWALVQLGGLQAPALARNLLAIGLFGLVALNAHSRSASWRLAALAVVLLLLMSINNLIIRTQNWAWIPFAAFCVILAAYAAKRQKPAMLALLPMLMIIWVNVHGSFVLGLVLIAIYCAGESLRSILGHADCMSFRQLRWLYAVFVLTGLATCINPIGLGMFGYVRMMLSDPSSQNLVNEWQSPTPRNPAGFFFFASVLILMVVLGLGRRRPTITDMLLVGAFVWLAWGGQRYVIWFGIVAMPILVQGLSTAQASPQRVGLVAINAVIAAVLLGLLLVCQPPLRNSLPFPRPYRELFANVPSAPLTYDASTPVEAVEWMRAHLPADARLFNTMQVGSYLIWALPTTPVFIDTRVELFPPKLWERYIEISNGRDSTSLLREDAVSHVLLQRDVQPELLARLEQEQQHWQLVYEDKKFVIYEYKQ